VGTNSLLSFLTLVAALGSGLIAGFLFAFSICVMQALAALPPAQGIAAMQSINVVIVNRWFLAPFFGVALMCLVLIALALLKWRDPRAAYWLAGGALYIAGAVLVTMLCNVPRNNALAAVAPGSAEGAALWADYLVTWTRWNHLRTLAALAAAACFTLALTC
jgi:uncharacterized membrane protein